MSRPGLLQRLGIDQPIPRAWAMYDWANSAMVTTIITAVFPVYFAEVAAKGLPQAEATGRYALATTIALSIVAVLAPFLGALADVRPLKKRLLLSFASLGIGSVACLFFVQQGDWFLALTLFVLANIGAAGSITFYDALLPHVVEPEGMDQLSSTGFALGYLGGGLVLALNLAWIQRPDLFGLPSGEGLSGSAATLPSRLAFLSVAVWWGLFTIPLARRVPEPPLTLERDEQLGTSPLRSSFTRLRETFRELRRYRQAFLMLIAFLVYNDGIVTIIRMAAIYGKEKQFSRGVLIGAILLVQFVGIPFALLFGRLARRFAAKRLVFVALAVYFLISILAYMMTSVAHFIALALLVAMVQGGAQALSRSLFASLIPKHKSGEFFALFGVGEKFAGIMGPGLFTLVISVTKSSQNAILSVVVFFAVGAWLLSRVDVEEGRRVARESDAEVRLANP